ncbi:unnamed protein product [Prunus armeniaca]
MRFRFQASNNEAEYEALIASLHLAKELGAASIHVHSDSQLVVNQVTNEYQAREPHLTAYVQKVKELLSHFRSHSITQIPSAKNTRADSLARLASAIDTTLTKDIPIEYLAQMSINLPAYTSMVIDEAPTWMAPIWAFLKPELRYTIINHKLYKRGHSLPLILCVTPEKGIEALQEIHEDICGDHAAA